MGPQHEDTGTSTATAVVLRYASLRDRGEDITPEALCLQMGCPHLLDEVKRQLRDLESIEQCLRGPTTDYRAPAPPPAGGEASPPAPVTIDHYEILNALGRGGFGLVWRALDTELGRIVALKVPRPDRGFSEEKLSLFYKEARKAAALDHPNIVRIYHAKRLGKTFFLVSEFIGGGNLGARSAEKPLSAEQAARLVAQVADALHHAHLRGFVHRDVKPGNILLNQDLKPYLADFGLAVTEEEQLEETPGIFGTVAYMSPEQAEAGNRRVDARTDVYSLGVVLYELLTGRLPFVAKTTPDYLEQIRHREPRPPRTINDSIPAELERICLKCLAKAVADRYTTAADLAADLRRWLERGSAPAAPPASPLAAVSTQVWTAPPRRRWLLPAAAGALALLGVVLLLVFKPWDDSPGPRPAGAGGTTRPQNGARVREPGAARPEPGKWHNLLEKEPDVLISPKNDFVKRFDRGKKYFWHTMGDCVFRLGSTEALDYEVEITLEQSRLSGHRGLFLGRRALTPEGKTHQSEAQVILFIGPGKPGNGAMLKRHRAVFNEKTRRAHFPDQLSPDVSLPGLSPQKITLAVRVEQGRLARVTVNQDEVKGLDLARQPGRPAPLVGDFGVYANHENAWLTEANWKVSERNAP
jgi:eukaryotic-like serine/threonine-protein kinase